MRQVRVNKEINLISSLDLVADFVLHLSHLNGYCLLFNVKIKFIISRRLCITLVTFELAWLPFNVNIKFRFGRIFCIALVTFRKL